MFNLYSTGVNILIVRIQPDVKYGEQFSVISYEVNDKGIERKWSSETLAKQVFYIKSVDKIKRNMNVTFNDEQYKTFIDNENLDFFKESSFLEMNLIVDYDFQDINSDGNMELILALYMTYKDTTYDDIFYCVYKYTDIGLEYLEGWFESGDLERSGTLEMNNYQ